MLAKFHGCRRQTPKPRSRAQSVAIRLLDHHAKFGHSIFIDKFFSNESDFDSPVVDRRASIQEWNLRPLESDGEGSGKKRHERRLGESHKMGR